MVRLRMVVFNFLAGGNRFFDARLTDDVAH